MLNNYKNEVGVKQTHFCKVWRLTASTALLCIFQKIPGVARAQPILAWPLQPTKITQIIRFGKHWHVTQNIMVCHLWCTYHRFTITGLSFGATRADLFTLLFVKFICCPPHCRATWMACNTETGKSDKKCKHNNNKGIDRIESISWNLKELLKLFLKLKWERKGTAQVLSLREQFLHFIGRKHDDVCANFLFIQWARRR